ncbi:hypothetical protein YYC_04302 [Plasmodium yoelii 17X]|uniref:Fam-a protein n=1 Tax=Plasmodium yoelii 17X TaxID=1323249 RepID=V7PF62_PLAYE|nr:hypothetical protein YYC_04302 [Plasmodium yoelii 17X]
MNKFYIKIAFFLLRISVYVNNKTLATGPVPKKDTASKPLHYSTSEEIYEKNKHLLCTDPEEPPKAVELMNEAVTHLAYHATSKDYKLCLKYPNNNTIFYKKKYEDNTNVKRIHFKIYNSDMYNDIINRLWDPDHANFFNTGSVKIVRVYNPNLVMIQQRYENDSRTRQKYFYALAAKVEISEDKTIIVMTSANINDHHPSNKKYKNTIIENANLFKTDIDSEDDIRNGRLKKTFVNIAGYLIKNKNKFVDITYVESVSDIHILIT